MVCKTPTYLSQVLSFHSPSLSLVAFFLSLQGTHTVLSRLSTSIQFVLAAHFLSHIYTYTSVCPYLILR